MKFLLPVLITSDTLDTTDTLDILNVLDTRNFRDTPDIPDTPTSASLRFSAALLSFSPLPVLPFCNYSFDSASFSGFLLSHKFCLPNRSSLFYQETPPYPPGVLFQR